MLELVLGALALSAYIGGAGIVFMAPLVPFLLIPVFPILCAAAVWPAHRIVSAVQGKNLPSDERDAALHFLECQARTGIFIGLTAGAFVLLANISLLTPESAERTGRYTATGIAAALCGAVLFRQIHYLSLKRKTAYPPAAALACLGKQFGLTRREIELTRLLADGASNREISRILSISEDTVKNHIYNIYRKAGVRNRNGLVGLLIKGGNPPS
jgi:DNA-binding CsgD family transcriptional regulator